MSLVLSGWYGWESGAAGEQNSASVLWSSTAVRSEIARLLAIRATTVDPQGSYYLTAGYALRCVISTAPLPRVVTRCPWCIQEIIIMATAAHLIKTSLEIGGTISLMQPM